MGHDDVKLAKRKWKYQTVESGTLDKIKRELNKAGQQGWELVTIIANPGEPGQLVAVFKKLDDD